MAKRKRQPPSYRQRKGYDQAIVTLTDSVTGYRKDYWLGTYGYHRRAAMGCRRPSRTDDDAQQPVERVL